MRELGKQLTVDWGRFVEPAGPNWESAGMDHLAAVLATTIADSSYVVVVAVVWVAVIADVAVVGKSAVVRWRKRLSVAPVQHSASGK